MQAATLPANLAEATGVLMLALATLMVGVHATLAGWGASRARLPERTRRRLPLVVAAFLGVWLAVAVVAQQRALSPDLGGIGLGASLVVMLVPFGLALAALRMSRVLRAVNAAMAPEWLVRAQMYRIAGFLFLYPFLRYGIIPAAFAVPSAVGDMLTAALAPVVARRLARGTPSGRRWAVAWNVFGVVDLVVAPGMALASGAQVVAQYPLALVPLFLGPPLGILTHIYSLRNLAVTGRVPGGASSGAPTDPRIAVAAAGAAS